MPETVLTPREIVVTGLAPNPGAANAGGSKFANDGKSIIHILNGSGAPITMTMSAQQPDDYQAAIDSAATAHSKTWTIAATSGEQFIGPFNRHFFNDDDGNAHITFSGVTSLTIEVLQMD